MTNTRTGASVEQAVVEDDLTGTIRTVLDAATVRITVPRPGMVPASLIELMGQVEQRPPGN